MNSFGILLFLSSLSLLELEDYCHLQELFWKTTVTVITVIVRIGRLLSFTRTLLKDHCYCHCQLHGLFYLELEDNCDLQELFWKATVTIIIVIVRIVRLLLFKRTLLEDHFHCHC